MTSQLNVFYTDSNIFKKKMELIIESPEKKTVSGVFTKSKLAQTQALYAFYCPQNNTIGHVVYSLL